MYQLIKPLLFRLDAEKAHHLVTGQLSWATQNRLIRNFISKVWSFEHPNLEREVMGLSFRNPVGLAAGFDKDARYLQGMSALGFGFLEIGTVTPVGQDGNPKPRLFRLPADAALINRMGFNNQGLPGIRARLEEKPADLIVGGNIGKNKATPNEQAVDDYLTCFDHLHPYVDYFVVNVSSPNTPGLRNLQDREPLTRILGALSNHNQKRTVARPILLKIAPDLSDEQILETIEIVREQGLQGIVATNTTISRENLKTPWAQVKNIGAGGLSGAPLRNRSTAVVKLIRNAAPDAFVIIGVGGIMSAQDAREKIEAGADLLQIYSGLVYRGPALVKEIKRELSSEL